MSKIVELAQAVENELNNLQDHIAYLEVKLSKEQEARKKYLFLLKEMIEDYEREVENI